MDSISLENMRFYAYHGCFDFEKEQGGWFEVAVKLRLDLTAAGKSDMLDDTVNYGSVYSLISEEMMIPSNLIENVAFRILERMKKEFPLVTGCSVSISKENPPFEGVQVGCSNGKASVTMSY